MSHVKKLEIKTALHILKPVHDVFEAIVDPDKLSVYFISKSSGRMESGRELIWQFPEMDLEFPIKVRGIEKDRYVSYSWKDGDQVETFVEITLRPRNESASTFVTITEKSRGNDKAGLKWLQSNTEGWANFLACLKAYLEYGINLRHGAFLPEQMPK